jgi:hypothetical protein
MVRVVPFSFVRAGTAATLVALAVIAAGDQRVVAQPGGASAVLARARDAMGFTQAAGRVLHYVAIRATEENYESDRTYPPFFSSMADEEIWLDAATGVLSVQSRVMFPGTGPSASSTIVDDGVSASVVADKPVAISRRLATGRDLSAWAVIADWSAASDVREARPEVYRDYDRVVLTRTTGEGEQRLFLDPKSGFPVKLDFVEPHYLWGQRHIEYVWSTWVQRSGVAVPGSAFRLADGALEMSETIGDIELVPRMKAPPLSHPSAPAEAPPDLPMFLRPLAPEIVAISERAWLLHNVGFNEAVVAAGKEIYVLDATQGDARASQDADLVTKLVPNAGSVTVIVTDLAWPHVAGVRYWVSKGATIVAHAAARSFLQQVVDRRWTLTPDALERARAKRTVPLKFVGVDRPTVLRGGAVQIIPIDGIGSEVALMAYMKADRFLWASDYIQTVKEPSLYAAEVIRAASRAGIEPEQVAAEHLPLTNWTTVRSAQSR